MLLPNYHNRHTEPTDAVRHWAELESKSATMAGDLQRQYANREKPRRELRLRPTAIVEAAIIALHALWFFRAR